MIEFNGVYVYVSCRVCSSNLVVKVLCCVCGFCLDLVCKLHSMCIQSLNSFDKFNDGIWCVVGACVRVMLCCPS